MSKLDIAALVVATIGAVMLIVGSYWMAAKRKGKPPEKDHGIIWDP